MWLLLLDFSNNYLITIEWGVASLEPLVKYPQLPANLMTVHTNILLSKSITSHRSPTHQ